jgi:hypothetical protein
MSSFASPRRRHARSVNTLTMIPCGPVATSVVSARCRMVGSARGHRVELLFRHAVDVAEHLGAVACQRGDVGDGGGADVEGCDHSIRTDVV